VTSAFCVSLPLIGILVFILRSPAMQRWGKEQATMPRFANPYVPNNPNPRPVSFFVDHAPEDRKVADEMIDVLKKYGHVQTAQLPDAESVLVLLSRYKNNSSADPEKQVVFPVILQTNKDISKDLSKVQWVDLRPGVRKLDAIAQLLPEPAKLLKALGNRPRGNQLVLPAPIMAMMYFLVVLGIFALGSFFQFFFGLAASDISSDTFGNAFGPALFPFLFILLFIGILLFSMARSLVQRRGRLASFRNFTIALTVLGFLLLGEVILGANVFDTLAAHEPNINEFASNVTLFPFLIYVIGGLIMAVFLFTRRKDILLWFPAKRPKT
jgi:hypothetical protein